MKKTLVSRPTMSTNVGIWSLFGGFLNVFGNTKIEHGLDVFMNLTFADALTMIIPCAAGVIAILHKEQIDGGEKD